MSTDKPNMDGVFGIVIAAMAAKADMLEREAATGVYECPSCSGELQARLMGPKQHIWAKCQNSDCGVGFIE